MSINKIAIIGTTNPKELDYNLIVQVSSLFASFGIKITTGGAKGIDEAAMKGTALVDPQLLSVYLPWKSYEGGVIPDGCNKYIFQREVFKVWEKSVDLYHPYPKDLSFGARSLHARNYGIICHESNVDAVIAVPRVGSILGGTGQGMRIAEGLGIKLYNLRSQGGLDELYSMIDSLVIE